MMAYQSDYDVAVVGASIAGCTAATRRLAQVALLAIAALAYSAPSSHAGLIVWQRGSEIHAMRDDGSGRVRLLRASSVPGASSIARPHVASNGTTVVFQSRSALGSGGFLTGVYKLGARTVSRLSPPGHDVEPEAAGTSGRVVFSHLAGAGSARTADIRSLSLFGGGPQLLLPGCRGVGDVATDPSVNPVAPTEVVYGGCRDAAGQYRLIASHPDRVGERVVRVDDDTPIVDPSFAPDGSQIVAVEGGNLPGIWAYPTGVGEPQRLLATPPGARPSSPRLIETGPAKTKRLLFAMHGDLWTVALADCPCTFPANATRLTRDGSAVADSSPAWTSHTSLGAALRRRSHKRS